MFPSEEESADLFDENKPWLKARMNLIKSQSGWWRNLPRFQFSWDILTMVENIRFDIYILTKGPRSKSLAWFEKLDCINNHFGCNAVVNIVGKDKPSYYGKFLCEDYLICALGWFESRSRGVVIMPTNEQNVRRFVMYLSII